MEGVYASRQTLLNKVSMRRVLKLLYKKDIALTRDQTGFQKRKIIALTRVIEEGGGHACMGWGSWIPEHANDTARGASRQTFTGTFHRSRPCTGAGRLPACLLVLRHAYSIARLYPPLPFSLATSAARRVAVLVPAYSLPLPGVQAPNLEIERERR
jgi:hypothetical protein